jgi:pimeloyl-ACP methyl ester carboxylesterase
MPSNFEPIGNWTGVMVREGKTLQVEFGFFRNSHRDSVPKYYCPMDRQVHSDHPGICPICGMDLVRESKELQATFTCMTQSAMEYPLEQLKLDGASFQALLGDSIVLDGIVEGDVIRGKFTDGTAQGTFQLHRAVPAAMPYSTRSVTFQNGGIKLAGTVCIPRTPGKHAGVVLLHGSGSQSRWGTNRYLADRFARAGIAALAYDKRGSGDSTGTWESSTYEDLAADALAGVAFLGSLPEVNAQLIGLHGHSEGGIVAPAAANIEPAKIAFIIAEDTVAGPVYQQDIYRTHVALMHSGFTPEQREAADGLYSLFVDAARGVVPRQTFREAALKAQKEPWFDWLGLPGDESWIWARYPKLGNVDTLRLWANIYVPMLLVYGERDQLVPVDESIARIEGALASPDSRNCSFIVPDAQHNLTIRPKNNDPFFWWQTAPGVYALVIDWVSSVTQRG